MARSVTSPVKKRDILELNESAALTPMMSRMIPTTTRTAPIID
jgi:hypothetical protein